MKLSVGRVLQIFLASAVILAVFIFYMKHLEQVRQKIVEDRKSNSPKTMTSYEPPKLGIDKSPGSVWMDLSDRDTEMSEGSFQIPENWQVFSLVDSRSILQNYRLNPSLYLTRYDLQEDLSIWNPESNGDPDWTSMPWTLLMKRYLNRYPQVRSTGQELKQIKELSIEEIQIIDRTRYRLVSVKSQ